MSCLYLDSRKIKVAFQFFFSFKDDLQEIISRYEKVLNIQQIYNAAQVVYRFELKLQVK
jgi:hypothetical protein